MHRDQVGETLWISLFSEGALQGQIRALVAKTGRVLTLRKQARRHPSYQAQDLRVRRSRRERGTEMAEHISGDGLERYAMGAVKDETELAALEASVGVWLVCRAGPDGSGRPVGVSFVKTAETPRLRALGGRSPLDRAKQMQ